MTKAKMVTDYNNNYFTNRRITMGSSAPTTGTYTVGDLVIHPGPNSVAYGWICVTSGTPGTWKTLKSAADVTSYTWGGVANKPSTFTPRVGSGAADALRGDYGKRAYDHSQSAHAPVNAQKNSDITKAEIEAKLTGTISSHTHNFAPTSHGRHVPGRETADNTKFLRNDGTWQVITPENINALESYEMPSTGEHITWTKIARVDLTNVEDVHAEVLVSGNGNFGNTGHSFGILRISGRTNGGGSMLLYNELMPSDGDQIEFYNVATSDNKFIDIWVKRPAYDGGGSLVVLNNTNRRTVSGKGVTFYKKGITMTVATEAPANAVRGSHYKNCQYLRTKMAIANDNGLMGTTNGATNRHYIFGVGSDNNIFLGMSNATYIHANNTIRAYQNIHVQDGAQLITPAMRIVSPSDWNPLNLGPNSVRIEYAKGDCAYIGGSESASTGYHLPFRANTLLAVNPIWKFGDISLTMSNASWSSLKGAVWIKNL